MCLYILYYTLQYNLPLAWFGALALQVWTSAKMNVLHLLLYDGQNVNIQLYIYMQRGVSTYSQSFRSPPGLHGEGKKNGLITFRLDCYLQLCAY